MKSVAGICMDAGGLLLALRASQSRDITTAAVFLPPVYRR